MNFNNKNLLWISSLQSILISLSINVYAQTKEGIDGRVGQGTQNIESPALLKPSRKQKFKLPPVPDFKGKKKLSDLPLLRVTAFDVVCLEKGSKTVISSVNIKTSVVNCETAVAKNEILSLLKPHEGNVLTAEQLNAVRDSITKLYISKGFITSGALIPNQKISNGVVALVIIQGKLSEVNILGLSNLSENYVRERFVVSGDEVLNETKLQDAFRLLINNPNINKIDARLYQGEHRGEAVFEMKIKEADRTRFSAGLANDTSPSIGGARVWLKGAIRNLVGYGDYSSFEYSHGDGYNSISAMFSSPLNANDLTLEVGGLYAKSNVVEQPLNILDIATENSSLNIGLKYPIFKNLTQEHTTTLRLKHADSKSFLLGSPFSFSPGAVDGRTKLNTLEWLLSSIQRGESSALALSSRFSYGLSGTQPTTVSKTTPEENFLVWLGQAQYVQRIGSKNIQFISRFDFQWTKDVLYSSQKLTIGGVNSVRGYRQNAVLADKGMIAALEIKLPWLSTGIRGGNVTGLDVLFFIDYGYGENNVVDKPTKNTLSGLGIGLIWKPTKNMILKVVASKPLKKLSTTGNDIQDKGIYFSISKTF